MSNVADKPTTVYVLRDAGDAVIYVGISYNWISRSRRHAADKDWWPEVASATFEHYEKRGDAAVRERVLIAALQPRYNVAHASGAGFAPMGTRPRVCTNCDGEVGSSHTKECPACCRYRRRHGAARPERLYRSAYRDLVER